MFFGIAAPQYLHTVFLLSNILAIFFQSSKLSERATLPPENTLFPQEHRPYPSIKRLLLNSGDDCEPSFLTFAGGLASAKFGLSITLVMASSASAQASSSGAPGFVKPEDPAGACDACKTIYQWYIRCMVKSLDEFTNIYEVCTAVRSTLEL
jgi:hypothetical protein